MSSDKLSNMREPVLVLTMTIASPEGRNEQIVTELRKSELDRLLEQFGSIQEVRM